MAEKQPDYKKSRNDPYDLNNVPPAPPERPTPLVTPSPYDLVEGTKVPASKDRSGNRD